MSFGVRPTVSVVLPTFNRRTCLPRAIESVLKQSFSDLELIIVDDGSSDRTDEYIASLIDPRIRYFRLPFNRGQSYARNLGIGEARGDFIAFQDSDDVWSPDKLAIQYDRLVRQPHVAMVYSDMLRVPLTGEPYLLAAPNLRCGKLFDARRSTYAPYGLGIQSCLIRRKCLLELSGFDEKMHQYEDLELFLRLIQKHHVVRIETALVTYHENNDGVSKQDKHNASARWRMLGRYGTRMLISRPRAFAKEWLSLALRRRQMGRLP